MDDVKIAKLNQLKFKYAQFKITIDFYHVMHFSAKRGLAITCRLSVCDVGGL